MMFVNDIAHIKAKVDMLNDWHDSVNVTLAKVERELEWIGWGVKIILITIVGTGMSVIVSALHPFH